MFSTSSFWFGLTIIFWKTSNTSKILQDLFWGRWEFSSKPDTVTSRNTFNIQKNRWVRTQDSGPIRISCAFTSPQMSSHGFVVVAPRDGDRKVLVHPKDGWINCQDLCALHLHSPSTWHQFWNQKMAEGACLGSRLDTWNGKNSLYLWEDCWEAHEYKQWKLEDSSQNTYTRTKSSWFKSFYCFFRVFDSYIHLSPSTPFHGSTRLPHPAGQLSSCRRWVTVTSVASHSGMTLFFLGWQGFGHKKWRAKTSKWNPGISIWHLLVEFWNAKHSRLSIRYIYIYLCLYLL